MAQPNRHFADLRRRAERASLFLSAHGLTPLWFLIGSIVSRHSRCRLTFAIAQNPPATDLPNIVECVVGRFEWCLPRDAIDCCWATVIANEYKPGEGNCTRSA